MSPEDTKDAVTILLVNEWDTDFAFRYVTCISCRIRHKAEGKNRSHRKDCALARIVRTYRLPIPEHADL